MAAFSHFNNLCLSFATFTCVYCDPFILNFAAKMELSIKEQNMTITVTLKEETAYEALDAAIVIITKVFGEPATEDAFERIYKVGV